MGMSCTASPSPLAGSGVPPMPSQKHLSQGFMPGVPSRLRSAMQESSASIGMSRGKAIMVICYHDKVGVSRVSGDRVAATATPGLYGNQKYKNHSVYWTDETLQHSIGRALWENRPMENFLAYQVMTAMRELGVGRTQIFLRKKIMICG